MARHTNTGMILDICYKCGMTGLAQVEHPRRQCRPRVSKRRAKKKITRLVWTGNMVCSNTTLNGVLHAA